MKWKLPLLVLGVVYLAGCGPRLEELSRDLASDEPGTRTQAAGKLCQTAQGRALLAKTAGPDTPLEVIRATAVQPDCFEALPLAVRVRYLLQDDQVQKPEVALAKLGAAAEPALVQVLALPRGPSKLRAARAMLAGPSDLAREARTALLDAVPALTDAGLDPLELEPLGDEAFLRLLQAVARGPSEVLEHSVETWWKQLPPAKQHQLLGESLRFRLGIRPVCLLGAPIWAQLSLRAPIALPGVGGLLLRTKSVKAVADGEPISERAWPFAQDLDSRMPVTLDLATIIGGKATARGTHTLSLVFSGELLEAPIGAGPAEATVVWSGDVATGPVSFEVAQKRLSDLIEPVASPVPDPGGAVAITLHAGGKQIELWPVPEGRPPLVVSNQTMTARLKITAKTRLAVGLAFEVLATTDQHSRAIALGAFSVPPEKLGEKPIDAATIDFASILPQSGGVTAHLVLAPSPEVAYRNPEIRTFWDQKLDCGPIQLAREPK